MLRKFKMALIGTAAMFLAATQVHAVQPGAYFGIGFGSAEDDVLAESDTGIKFYGGVNVDGLLGLEFSYVDLGNYVNNTLSQDGVAIEAVLFFPVGASSDIFLKGGLFSWEVNTLSATDTGTDPVFGVGLQTMFNSQTGLRIEYQLFQDISGGDVELISVGLSRHF